jgi:hypothetical protein
MTNFYDEHIARLRLLNTGDHPAVSMFIPLRNSELFPNKIFFALIKAANSILQKEGYSKLEIVQPNWNDWAEDRTGTLAIYHYGDQTHLIPLPMKMDPRFVVASSFHIKPLITASNDYCDGLVLHFNGSGASLYSVNPLGHSLVDHYLPSFSSTILNKDWPTTLNREALRNFLEFIFLQVKNSMSKTTRFVGITGQSFHELRSETFWNRLNTNVLYIDESFNTEIPFNSFSLINFRISQFLREKYQIAVQLGLKSIEENQHSYEDVWKKLISGKIKYLCVSLDEMHFGEVNRHSGEIIINRFQQNTRDDDVLDDLVELAISKGVEVNVVPKKYLPQGRAFVYA